MTEFISYTNLNKKKLANLAKLIAMDLDIGDVLTLHGDLGAGKTTFTYYLINSLMEKNTVVTSPTFNLVNIYQAKKFNIWHFDLYRIKKTIDLYEIGIEDAINSGVSIIEWPEIAIDILPKNCKKLTISISQDKKLRNVTFFNN